MKKALFKDETGIFPVSSMKTGFIMDEKSTGVAVLFSAGKIVYLKAIKYLVMERKMYESPVAQPVPVWLEADALVGVSPTGETFDDQEEYDGF